MRRFPEESRRPAGPPSPLCIVCQHCLLVNIGGSRRPAGPPSPLFHLCIVCQHCLLVNMPIFLVRIVACKHANLNPISIPIRNVRNERPPSVHLQRISR